MGKMLAFALALLGIAGAAAAAPAGIVLHVAPAGRDTWSGARAVAAAGRSDGPLASLQGARDRLRALRRAGKLSGPATVLVHAGTYRLSEPLVFRPEDSGTAAAPVLYAAAPGEKVTISGGRPITGWQRQGNLWTTEVPGVREGEWYFRQLFVNGERRQRARTPNAGFFNVDGSIENTFQWGQPRENSKPSTFKYRGDDILKEWAGRRDVEVVALQSWAEIRMEICGVDAEKRTVTLAGACSPSNREGNARYWVENAIECLDSPGEWYLDRATGVLSYWPLPGEEIGKLQASAPAVTQLVRFEGDPAKGATVHHIGLAGFTLCDADWTLVGKGDVPLGGDAAGSVSANGAASCSLGRGYVDVQAAFDIPGAVTATGATDCSLERCRITNVGTWALEFGAGCKRCRVDRCEMTSIGAGGVKIGEAEQRKEVAEQTSGITVSNCRIHDIGIVYPAAIGVWIGQSYDNTVSHNDIFDTCYSAVSVGWTWGYTPTLAHGNVVEFNHLYNIARGWLSDLGAVYTLGMQPGTVIRNNVVHDVDSYGYGGWGLYTDEGSSGIVLENNIVYRTKSGGFHQHYGKENVVRNNVFAFAREGQIIRSREEAHRSFTFEHNIVCFSQGSALGSNWNNNQFAMDYNLYWYTREQPMRMAKWSWEEWQQKGYDAHSLVADPLFADPAHGDFTLKPDSPALKLGFKPIDTSQVGPAVDPPGAFKALGPRGSTTVLPAFEWEESPGAASYTLVVSRKRDLSAPLLKETVAGTRFTPAEPLPAGAPLYWKVTAVNRKASVAAAGGLLALKTDRPLPWWDRQWACRRRVVLTPPPLSAPLEGFPLLVRLDAADKELWARARADGSDLRFVAEDAGRWQLLPHEVERFDPKAGVGEVWVRVPRLLPGAGQYFWLYFGNAKAPAPAPAAGVWAGDSLGVWHLVQTDSPLRNSTGRGADLGWVAAPHNCQGVVAGGWELNGHDIAAAPSKPLETAHCTLSCWVKGGPQPDGAMVVSMPGAVLQAWFNDKLNPGVNTPAGWGGFAWVPDVPVLDNAWHHVTLTYDGRKQVYYVDGSAVGEKAFSGDMVQGAGDLDVGGVPGGKAFTGAVDEVRLESIARPADWIRASYECQRLGSKFVSIHQDAGK